ncbi:MAG: Rieske (2Fe-2S) protein [Planctomycetes bacterium]|nr:Rieske (2Fe-2S) protein [Planctomycetota bacterium]MCW8135145.1 Rieske (2Fe-2S) protein [Planctomycetota bacterium]
MLRAKALPLDEPVALDVALTRREGWRVRSTRRQVLVVRTGDETFKAFSPVCPHKGCGVQPNAKEKKFVCPCHDAQFDIAGELKSGPAPRGLDPLELTVAEHEGAPWLFVTWQEFVAGIPERTGRQA